MIKVSLCHLLSGLTVSLSVFSRDNHLRTKKAHIIKNIHRLCLAMQLTFNIAELLRFDNATERKRIPISNTPYTVLD